MRRQLASLLITCGALLIVFGFGGWAGPATASAQAPAPQPSPRPAIRADDGGSDSAPVAQTGRVTGTVIDQLSGAPLAGVRVLVGNDVATTDANGNYDHWLPVGTYNVMAAPDEARVALVAPPVPVVVTAGGTVVQHLQVRGPQAPAAPAEEQPGRAVAPPAALAAEPPVAAAQLPTDDEAPRILPRTGLEADMGGLWLGAGVGLLLMGWLVWGRPVARLAPALSRAPRLPEEFDRNAMLAGLLGAKETRRDLLDELLDQAQDDQ
jgi:hypothetical protein